MEYDNETSHSMPYIISIEKGVNATEDEPFFVSSTIVYDDLGFSKRMGRIFSNEDLGIYFEFQEKNTGSLFKPKHETVLFMKLIENRTALIEASKIAGIASLGFSNINAERDTLKMETILAEKIKFDEKSKAQLFAKKVEEILISYLEKEYSNYQLLLSEEF